MPSKPKLVVLDFETYYDNDYSLTKLTTEAYIRNPRFEIIGVSYKVGGAPAVWASLPSIKAYAKLLAPLKDHFVVCHNMAFDGAILGWLLDVHPKFMFDTLSMARPENQMTVGGSLKALADKYTVGQKGTEVIKALGKHRADFTEDELHAYGNYCKNDVELTHLLFQILKSTLPTQELKVIDMMLRMYTQPKLVLDKDLLINHLDAVEERKEKLMDIVGTVCGQDELMSNNKLAEVLRKLGVEPPTKMSLRTGKETFAFGKTDVAFKALLEHENDAVQAVVSARLGVKSTLEETRTRAFIDIAERGPLPIMLNYYGAHTGRASGGDKINLQNLPRGGALRKAIRAPDGFRLIACDSAQIEARVVAWLAGQDDLVADFARGEDIYSKFASMVYGRTITKSEHKVERHVGKTCLAEGTLILTQRGEVPIEEILTTDRVWDGVEWVGHDGVVYQGEKDVITYQGLTATEDHGVFTARGVLPFGAAASGLEELTRTGDAGEAVRVGSDFVTGYSTPEEAHIRVHEMHQMWKRKVDSAGKPHERAVERVPELLTEEVEILEGAGAAIRRNSVQVHQPQRSGVQALRGAGGEMLLPYTDGVYPVGREEPATYGLPGCGDRPDRQQPGLRTGESSPSYAPGADTEPKEHGESAVVREASSTSGVSFPVQCSMDAPSGSSAQTDRGTNTRKVRVYDILNAGPRRRYTANGILVFNCILGLGYGMGNVKFKDTLKTGNPSVEVSADEARRIVSLYRDTYPYIKKLWYAGGDALRNISAGRKYAFGRNGLLTTTDTGILLPNGMQVRYPNLTSVQNEFIYTRDPRQVAAWTTMRLTGEWDLDKLSRIYDGKVIENVVQALARIVVFDQMVAINRKYPVVLTVHDEVVCLVPEDEVDEAKAFMLEEMSKAPIWAPDLPIACEANIGTSYGEAK